MTEYLSKPPDGGWGWLIVFGGMYCLAMWGSNMRCYSAFYSSHMNAFDADFSSVAWLIGMFQIGYGLFSKWAFFKTNLVVIKQLSFISLQTIPCSGTQQASPNLFQTVADIRCKLGVDWLTKSTNHAITEENCKQVGFTACLGALA